MTDCAPLAAIVLLLPLAVPAAEDCDCGSEVASDPPALSSPSLAAELLKRSPPGDRVRLDLFVMSLCPYGMDAERAVIDLLEHTRVAADLNIHFIADEAAPIEVAPGEVWPREVSPSMPAARAGCAAAATSGSGRFRSLHGQPEIDEARRQLVVRERHPDAHLPYVRCRNLLGVSGDWRQCAQQLAIDPGTIDSLASGSEGELLFADNIRVANQLDVELSPTLFVDGNEYDGRIEPLALGRGLCSADPLMEVCAELPVCGADRDCEPPPGQVAICLQPDTPTARCIHSNPVSFALQVLLDDDCELCDHATFVATTRELFPGARVSEHALDRENPMLARRYGVKQLPAYIFSPAFSSTARFSRVRHLLEPREDAFLLAPGVSDATYWYLRPPIPDRVDLFLPAARFLARPDRGALDLEDRLVDLWREGRDVQVHFVGFPAGLLLSPADELARRACVADVGFSSYRAYATARNAFLRQRSPDGSDEDVANWRAALENARMDRGQLGDCLPRSLSRLDRDSALADNLGVAAHSVSVLLGNRTLVRRIELPEQLATLGR